MNRKPAASETKVGEILVRRGIVTQAQLEDALVAQGSSLLPIGSTLVRLGNASEEDVARALAEQMGVPAVSLSRSTLDLSVLSVVPREVAVGHRLLPLSFSGPQALSLGMARPRDQALLDEISFASGRSALPFVVPRMALEETIKAVYEARARGETTWQGPHSTHTTPHLEVLQPEASPAPDAVAMTPEVSASTLDAFPEAPEPTPRAPGTASRILAVDDEPEILDIIGAALGAKGYEVVRATRGREALELLRTCQPDLVLLDAMLPEIHGFELCREIKRSEQYRHIPVIMISAVYTGWNISQDVRKVYGADDYIEKPFRYKDMVHRVEQALGRAGGQPGQPSVDRGQRECRRHIKIALESLQARNPEGALAAAEGAVTADAFEPRAHFVLASALQASGRAYESISAYERVVELAPDQFSALKNLAVLYERQGFKTKAVEMWMRALENSPTDAVRLTIKSHLLNLL